MAVNNRLILDFVTEDTISEGRLNQITREAINNLYVIVAEDDDSAHTEIEKWGHIHEHDTSDGIRCNVCVEVSLDERSGDNYVEGNV